MPQPPRLIPRDEIAHEALRRAHAEDRIVFFTDPKVHNHPGSPVWDGLDVFVPPVILFTSSITLLFAFGMEVWIAALVVVLLWQAFGAPRFVMRRQYRRAVEAMLRNLISLKHLWEFGGIVIAMKDWPERNCKAPLGNWQLFVAQNLMSQEELDLARQD